MNLTDTEEHNPTASYGSGSEDTGSVERSKMAQSLCNREAKMELESRLRPRPIRRSSSPKPRRRSPTSFLNKLFFRKKTLQEDVVYRYTLLAGEDARKPAQHAHVGSVSSVSVG